MTLNGNTALIKEYKMSWKHRLYAAKLKTTLNINQYLENPYWFSAPHLPQLAFCTLLTFSLFSVILTLFSLQSCLRTIKIDVIWGPEIEVIESKTCAKSGKWWHGNLERALIYYNERKMWRLVKIVIFYIISHIADWSVYCIYYVLLCICRMKPLGSLKRPSEEPLRNNF